MKIICTCAQDHNLGGLLREQAVEKCEEQNSIDQPTDQNLQLSTCVVTLCLLSFCTTVETLLSGHHYCKPKVAVQDRWPLIGGRV